LNRYAPNDYFTINALPTAAVDNTKARYAWYFCVEKKKKQEKSFLTNTIYNRERKIEIKEVEGQIAVIIEIISHLCYSTFKILYYNDRC